MILKDFLYFIVDKNGNSYRVTDGVVGTSSTPTPLPNAPDGWSEKSIQFGRSAKYFGLFRSFTTPLKFVNDGAKILRDALFRFGIEAERFLIITKLDKAFGGEWKHRHFYRGELDLSKSKSEESFFTANVMEGDLEKRFRANENTVYEIDIDVPEAVNVKMDGLTLQSIVTYSLAKSLAAQSLGRKQILPMIYTKTDGNFFHFTFTNDYGDLLNGAANEITSDDLTTSDKWIFKTSKPVTATIRISGAIYGLSGNAGNTWHIETSAGQSILMGTIEHTLAGAEIPFDLSATVTLAADEKVFVYRSSTVFNNNGLWNYTGETKIDVTTKDKADATFVKALRLTYIAQQLLNKMTGSTAYTFESEFLSTLWKNLCATGFDAVRGIPSPKMRTSWADFYNSVDVVANCSLAIKNNKLIIESKAAAFDASTVTALGPVKELTVEPYEEQIANGLRIGYPDLRNEDVNGRDEFNTQLIFTGPGFKSSKELVLVSNYTAAIYEIELARIRLNNRDTTNNEVDSSVAFLHIEDAATTGTGTEPATYHKLYRRTYDSITGVIDPETIFNVELSPKRCLLRRGNMLRSIFYRLEAGTLKFQSSPRNAELKTVIGSETIQEKADVFIGSLDAPLFLPYAATFKSDIPATIIDDMTTNPARSFSFEWDGQTYYGYATEVKIQPATNAEQETVLLFRPDSDITKLI